MTTVRNVTQPPAINSDRLLPMPDEAWRVCAVIGCQEEYRIDLHNGRWSLGLWLQRVRSDRRKLLEARTLLSQRFLPWAACQFSDEDVLERLTDLLESGRLHLHAPPAPVLTDVAWDATTADDEDFYTPAASQSAPVEDPSTFGTDSDAGAQAAALAAAAAAGVPFCQQCAAAAARRASTFGS
jgi:hypothetical protein